MTDWPSRDEFSRMTPAEVNAFLVSIGASQRVVDEPDIVTTGTGSVDLATPRPWGTKPSQSRDPMQRYDVGITTPDAPRPGYLGLVGEVFAEREQGRPDKARAEADAALICAAVNAYDRLRAVEVAAREFRDAQDADTGHPGADAARIADAIDRLRSALQEQVPND